MTMTLPDNLPILSRGRQKPGSGKVCAEQAINWLASGRLDLADETDHPSWVQPVLNTLAVSVNDYLSDARRAEMWTLILRQPGTARPEMEPVLSVRLAAFIAEQVLDPVRPSHWQTCRNAITAAQAWCDNPSQMSAAAAVAASYAVKATINYAAARPFCASLKAAEAASEAASYDDDYAASCAVMAASYAADAAYHEYPVDLVADRLIALLGAAQDECERLTGHVPMREGVARLARLSELVGTCSLSR